VWELSICMVLLILFAPRFSFVLLLALAVFPVWVACFVVSSFVKWIDEW
jgi:hypothetical protein